MDLSSKKSLSAIKIVFFVSLIYTFLVGDKKFSTSTTDRVSLVICALLYILYMSTQYLYGRPGMKKAVIIALVLSCVSLILFKVFVFR